MILRARSLPLVGFLVLVAGAWTGCASNEDGEVEVDSIVARLAGVLGRDDPTEHLRRFSALHDAATFRHTPDVPPTYERCRDELRWLAGCDYVSWKDVALSTYFVCRAAVDDASSLSRGEAVAGLRRLGSMLLPLEDRGGGATAEGDVLAAMRRLREIHGPDGTHLAADGAQECAALVGVLGAFRADAGADASPAQLRARLKDLRGILNLVVGGGFADEVRDAAGAEAVDRALIGISAQSVRLSLLLVLRSDDRPVVRAAAASVLADLADAASAPGLAAARASEDAASVRLQIVRALGAVAAASDGGAGAAVPALLDALGDEDDAAAHGARAALTALAGEDLGAQPSPWREWWSRHRPTR